jgi:S-adenosylmethionine:tRNA ribosyltransferase-isomerase
MLVAEFDFVLPAEAIAQEARPRGESRLLVVDAVGVDRHARVADLPGLLRRGDLLVVNDTRVIPARLYALPQRAGGDGQAPTAAVELLLVEPVPGTVNEWLALAKPGRRVRPGTRLVLLGPAGDDSGAPQVEVVATTDDGRRQLRFDAPVEPHLERLGHVPLPPYIKRPDTAADRERYQTVWARAPGAIAAPTAGLHFTPEILAALANAGIEQASVTLHVGIGTFKPVTATLVHEHQMEAERYVVPAATAEAIAATRARGGRVVAVGTTVVRTLESAALADPSRQGEISDGERRTSLFITPGFPFQVVDVLLTNFHLPCSTLLMLVAAFAGQERVLGAYREAVAEGYRFYSYGDAMLVSKNLEQTRD